MQSCTSGRRPADVFYSRVYSQYVSLCQELENLLEKGVLTEDVFASIHRLLPAEGTLSGAGAASAGLPTPATTPSNHHAAPPPYSHTNSGGAAPPPLPGRKTAEPPAKPVIARCRALYQYAAQDSRDCSFEKGDRLAVYEKMNADWWLGLNERTKEEGIFPKAYVEEEQTGSSGGWGNEKAAAAPAGSIYPGQSQQGGGYGGYPPPPGRANPYNAHAPPMAMANTSYGGNGQGQMQQQQPQQPSKMEENGTKFGKKLGNAAIFGAGATLGGKIVNSIF